MKTSNNDFCTGPANPSPKKQSASGVWGGLRVGQIGLSSAAPASLAANNVAGLLIVPVAATAVFFPRWFFVYFKFGGRQPQLQALVKRGDGLGPAPRFPSNGPTKTSEAWG